MTDYNGFISFKVLYHGLDQEEQLRLYGYAEFANWLYDRYSVPKSMNTFLTTPPAIPKWMG
jgi:hypothetical protein